MKLIEDLKKNNKQAKFL